MTFKLLCCDGGGIRGLITALLIQNLEESCPGCPVIANADGFAGTSTGGLIALALASDVPINKIIEVYEKRGKQIFEPNGWLVADKAKAPAFADHGDLDAFWSGPGVTACQYKNDGLIAIARGLLKDRRLSDAAKYVAVNTARLWDHGSWRATTFSNASGNPYADVKMYDAALATSAAPTYFPPYEIGNLGFFADGGTFANNPSMTALADARAGKRFGTLDEVVVLSIGTGVVPQGIQSIDAPLDWGVNHWMWPWASGQVPGMPLLNLMMTGTAQAATAEASQLLADQFCRADVPLSSPIGLDDWEQVGELEKDTRHYMNTSEEWEQVRCWVKTNWSGR